MEGQTSTTTIIINVLIQVANLVIFFLLFKYFLWDKVSEALLERELLIKKLKNAESEYHAIIQQAEAKKDLILADSLNKQKTILQEGELLNKKLNQEILEDAQRKAEEIIKHATTETKRAQEELASNWESAVKKTSKAVVKKLLKEDKQLQDAYLSTLVDDVKNQAR